MNRKVFNIRNVITVIWVLLIWGQSIMPGSVSTKESGMIFNFIHSIFPFITHYMVRKAAHFGEYMILGILIEKKAYVTSAFICLLVAMVDESIQFFVADRGSQISDVWIDFAGALCGILICKIYREITRPFNI